MSAMREWRGHWPLFRVGGGEEEGLRRAFDVAKLRAQRASLIGLTYDEYVLEILERGRYLNASDTERIAQIVARRGVRY